MSTWPALMAPYSLVTGKTTGPGQTLRCVRRVQRSVGSELLVSQSRHSHHTVIIYYVLINYKGPRGKTLLYVLIKAIQIDISVLLPLHYC